MNKKQTTIVFMLSLLAFFCILYIVITKKNGDDNKVISEGTEGFYSENSAVTEIKVGLAGSNDELSFGLNGGSWVLLSDSYTDFPLDQNQMIGFANSLINLTVSRSITDYGSFSDFGLESDDMYIDVVTDKNDRVRLILSDLAGVDNNYYFRVDGDSTVYMTGSKISEYCRKNLIDFATVPETPDFSSLPITRMSFDINGGEKINLLPLTDNKDRKTVSNLDWGYYTYYTGAASDLTACDANDFSVLTNYIKEFKYNRAVSVISDESELSAYGLDHPGAVVTFEFSGYSKKQDGSGLNQMSAADFVMKLSIGDKISEEEYYVKADCTDSVNEFSQYGSPCVLTMNAVYCNYFLGLSESKLDGSAASEVILLEKEKLPVLTAENIVGIEFLYGEELKEKDHTVFENTGSQWLATDANGNSSKADESRMSQLVKLLTDSGYYKYQKREGMAEEIEECSLPTADERKEKDFSPLLSLTINFLADSDQDEKPVTEVSWTLFVLNSKDEKSYYVSADNADYIYSMDSVFIDFLLQFI